MNHAEIFEQMVGRMEFDPKVEHHFSDGVYAKKMVIPAGFMVGQHQHKYSHLSILATGRVVLRTDVSEKVYSAPACLEIKSGLHHSIEALEDSIWYCIHATDEKDESKIDEVLIRG